MKMVINSALKAYLELSAIHGINNINFQSDWFDSVRGITMKTDYTNV